MQTRIYTIKTDVRYARSHVWCKHFKCLIICRKKMIDSSALTSPGDSHSWFLRTNQKSDRKNASLLFVRKQRTNTNDREKSVVVSYIIFTIYNSLGQHEIIKILRLKILNLWKILAALLSWLLQFINPRYVFACDDMSNKNPRYFVILRLTLTNKSKIFVKSRP